MLIRITCIALLAAIASATFRRPPPLLPGSPLSDSSNINSGSPHLTPSTARSQSSDEWELKPLYELTSPFAGTITEIVVRERDRIEQGEILYYIQDYRKESNYGTKAIRTPCNIEVARIFKSVNSKVRVGDVLMHVYSRDSLSGDFEWFNCARRSIVDMVEKQTRPLAEKNRFTAIGPGGIRLLRQTAF